MVGCESWDGGGKRVTVAIEVHPDPFGDSYTLIHDQFGAIDWKSWRPYDREQQWRLMVAQFEASAMVFRAIDERLKRIESLVADLKKP